MTAVTAKVLTSEGTTSTTYTDLTTKSDTVTVTVGASGMVLVCMSTQMSNSSTTANFASYDVSGANTSAASDTKCLRAGQSSNSNISAGLFILETGLSTGSTTFKMKYRSSSGSITANFSNRYITAIPLEDLTTGTAAAAYVSTAESTSSNSYTDLTTTTDTVTVTIGPSRMALVMIYSYTDSFPARVSYNISGATTTAASDTRAIYGEGSTGFKNFGACFLETGLTPGSTTFKMKYRIISGASRFFKDRRIAVIPL